MSDKFSKEPLRGMKDFYPSDLREVNWVMDYVKDIADLYSYEEFEAPLLEPIAIYAAKSSEELVNEQSFIVDKKKEESERLILRPELTPSLARMIARRSQELKKPIRWFSIPDCYRYERPQKGRLREFKQINMDILGEDSIFAEVEIFNIIIDTLTSFGANANQFQIYYNSRRFVDAICDLIIKVPKEKKPLVYKILDKADKLDESEFEKYVVDTFQEESVIQGILKLKNADKINDLLQRFSDIPKEFYDSAGYKELVSFENILQNVNLSDYCSFSSSIVRGLDYYTGIVFEVFDTGSENIRAIAGGGRYDDLLSLFSEEKISGIGFGMGVLMLTLFLQTYNLIPEEIYQKDNVDTIYIASINDQVAPYAFELAHVIRQEFPCIIDYRFKNIKTQLSKANEQGVLIAIIVGPKEMADRKVTIRNMDTEEQTTVDFGKITDEIYKILSEYEN